jgi:hypothetical protein
MFSARYRTFGDWLAAQHSLTDYVRKIQRLHARYPGAILSQLRRHPAASLSPLGKLKPARHPRLPASILSARERDAQRKALRAAALMRRQGLPFTAAAKRAGISPSSARRLLKPALRRRSGKVTISKRDTISRPAMRMLDERGEIWIVPRSSADASKIGRYWATLYKWKQSRPRDNAILKPFDQMTVADADGNIHRFVTDPKTLERIFRSREARFESVYEYGQA